MKNQKLAICIAALLFITGIAGSVGAFVIYFREAEIQTNGLRARGTILKKESLKAADGDSDFTINYVFVSESGQSIKSTRGLSKELWSQLYPQQVIEIAYSNKDPHRNFPTQHGRTSLGLTLFIFVISSGLAIFGGLILYGLFFKTPREVP